MMYVFYLYTSKASYLIRSKLNIGTVVSMVTTFDKTLLGEKKFGHHINDATAKGTRAIWVKEKCLNDFHTINAEMIHD